MKLSVNVSSQLIMSNLAILLALLPPALSSDAVSEEYSQDVLFLGNSLDRLDRWSASQKTDLDVRSQSCVSFLEAAIQKTEDAKIQSAVKEIVENSNARAQKMRGSVHKLADFSATMGKIVRATSSLGHGCDSLTCSQHASCSETVNGALCICNSGFVGDGKVCYAPPEFLPHRLLLEGLGGLATTAADFHVTAFASDRVAIVFRDTSKADIGRIVVASVREAGKADLAPPEQFTLPNGKAFSPVVAGFDSKKLMVAWRDEDTMGSCWIRGAAMGVTGIASAKNALTWGKPVNFCSDQAHKMAILAMPNDSAMILYSDKVAATQKLKAESFGSALLAAVKEDGSVHLQGDPVRFTDSAVTRLEVTPLTATRFVLAARATPIQDEEDRSKKTRQEALSMLGEYVDGYLVFDPNVVNLEPDQKQIWARGISTVTEDSAAYAYVDGTDKKMKMAIVDLDPAQKTLKVAQKPVELMQGFSPYVSMISLPADALGAHSLVVYEGSAGSSMVNLCSWNTAKKKLHSCEDFTWLAHKLSSVSGVHLGAGKVFMVFSTENGLPYYSVFGLSKAP